MANTRRQDRQRAAALHLIHRQRYGVREVARILGVPKSTVHDWHRQGPAGILNPRLRDVAQAAVDQSMVANPPSLAGRWRELAAAVVEASEGAEVEEMVRLLAEKPDVPPAPTGSMVAFFLPAAAAAALALAPDEVEGAEPADELHLTLAFLGPADQVEDPQRLARVVAGFAAVAPAVDGEVSGVGRFSTGDKPVYASYDAPTLPSWRQRLVEVLELAGYRPARNHGFSPHITLAYDPGPIQLDVHVLAIRFDVLTLAIGGQRYDYPLEGTVATFAEAYPPPAARPGPPERSSRVDEPRPVKRKPGDFAPEGDQPPSKANIADERVLSPGQEGGHAASAEAGGWPEVDIGPPLMDRLYLEAMHRWFNLIRADVPHHRALTAVQRIDPDFGLTSAQVARAYHALGKGDDPVRLGEPATTGRLALAAAGHLRPPAYVEDVYKACEVAGQRHVALAKVVLALAEDAYLAGASERRQTPFRRLPADMVPVLQRQAERVAASMGTAFNRELAFEVYCGWLLGQAERGPQMDRAQLEESTREWAQERADQWSQEMTLSEADRWMAIGEAEDVPGGTAQVE